ncbi:hypothetical protein V6L77_15515 [Pannonibacter sp. Pt2-lr]
MQAALDRDPERAARLLSDHIGFSLAVLRRCGPEGVALLAGLNLRSAAGHSQIWAATSHWRARSYKESSTGGLAANIVVS